MATTLHQLAHTAQDIAETRSTNSKISRCAAFLMSIEEDQDLQLAARYLGEGAFSDISGKRASIGSRTYSLAAAHFCEIDYEQVFRPCKTALGSASETIEKLMANLEVACQKRQPAQFNLQQAKQIYRHLYQASARAEKEKILQKAWSKMTPLEIKYFIRIMAQGSLRIGFETRSLTSAIAEAFDQSIEEVRYAHMITGSIGKTAVLCKNNELEEANFKLFHPLSFMLASTYDSESLGSLKEYIAEEKFDGMRAQAHIQGQKVQFFSRDLNDITPSFPDLQQFFMKRSLPEVVLDGEICVFKDNKILSFQMLQKRMGRKKPSRQIMKKYPVLFIAFDVLYHKGHTVFDWPLQKRRELLQELSETYQLPISNQFAVNTHEHIDRLFERALAHGNEGLLLKKENSRYEYGQRRKSWIKVKKPGGTLDTAIMYAHAGSGKRGGYYSDFTLGISVKEDDRYEEEFIPIGKAYGGYTDEEMKKLNKKIKELTVEKYGPTLGLIPEIMVEIEFDDIQVNKRTKANYTLRLPRFKAIRWDLGPKDADTLKDVEQLYKEKMNRDRLKQDENPSFLFSGR